MTLTHQVQNLSSIVSSLSVEASYLSDEIGALSERLADSEAKYHGLRNINIELESNCTALASTIIELRREADELGEARRRLEERDDEREGVLDGLRAELRTAKDDLERLACLVETDRFEEERAKFLDDFDEKRDRERERRKKMMMKKKSRGGSRSFWAWFFGWGGGDGTSDYDDDDDDGALSSSIVADAGGLVMDDQERERAAREFARTTLLHALQAERANVDELESALEALRRNNTAIMDVVSSRDTIISELNDRVAVFEEDRMVLRAALRQLQAEMRDEAPRTERMVRDLEEARERESRLIEDMKVMSEDMRQEREELESRITNVTGEHNRTREELDLIGLYVDQLEDRLANFAIARRELEVREKECGRLESAAKEQADLVDEYRRRADVLMREQNETRALIEELVVDREGLRARIEALNQEVADWKTRVDDADRRTEDVKSQSVRQLFLRLEEEKASWEELSQRRMQEERLTWDEENEKVLERTLANERAAWEACIAEEWKVRLNNEKSELERIITTEWTERQEKERLELESRHLEEMQFTIAAERRLWEGAMEAEINDRISTARSLWEKEADAKRIDAEQRARSFESSLLEEEVEKAAAKVYTRLEERGVRFGVSNPPSGRLTDLFDSSVENDVNSLLVDRSETEEYDKSDNDFNDFDDRTETGGRAILSEAMRAVYPLRI
ncbi:hypothetical protein ACHAXA_001048 [Cyclostephanos tholiformis]|uniref:Uncharacterized protein n=1 Tax=Cyclostephanos tholiformis TaxID=382380 RepID=A0ABD3RD06_9STRA